MLTIITITFILQGSNLGNLHSQIPDRPGTWIELYYSISAALGLWKVIVIGAGLMSWLAAARACERK